MARCLQAHRRCSIFPIPERELPQPYRCWRLQLSKRVLPHRRDRPYPVRPELAGRWGALASPTSPVLCCVCARYGLERGVRIIMEFDTPAHTYVARAQCVPPPCCVSRCLTWVRLACAQLRMGAGLREAGPHHVRSSRALVHLLRRATLRAGMACRSNGTSRAMCAAPAWALSLTAHVVVGTAA